MGEQFHSRIEIGARCADEDDNPIFFVSDNGIGIESQYHEKVFGLFNKLDPHTEGTGVDLPWSSASLKCTAVGSGLSQKVSVKVQPSAL